MAVCQQLLCKDIAQSIENHCCYYIICEPHHVFISTDVRVVQSISEITVCVCVIATYPPPTLYLSNENRIVKA